MITQSDSGLSAEDYAIFQSGRVSTKYSLDAYQWLPTFETFYNPDVVESVKFTSIVFGGSLYRFRNGDAEKYNGSVWSIVAGFSESGSVRSPYSCCADNDGIYIMTHDSGSLYIREFDGTTWGAWYATVTASNIVFSSIATPLRYHYVTRDPIKNTYRLNVVDNGDLFQSDIYLQYPLRSFSVQNDGSRDLVVLSSDMPGNVSAITEGVNVRTFTKNSNGIISFFYSNGDWSEHIIVDGVDEFSPWQYRSSVRCAVVNGMFAVTAYCAVGTKANPISMYRTFLSKDGIHWSRGEFLVESINTNGVEIRVLGNYIFAVGSKVVSRAKMTLLYGTPEPSTVINLDSRVTSVSFGQQDMAELQFSFSNEDNWADSTFIFTSVCAVILKVSYLGVEVQVGIYEIDTIIPAWDVPRKMVSIKARDRTSWMSTRTQAEQALFREPQYIRADRYQNLAGIKYGGMSNTAPLTGTWDTDNNTIILKSSNKEGMALSSMIFDVWNGSAQVGFKFPMEENEEYAGITFRSIDRDNFWSVSYKRNTDSIVINQSVGGIVTTKYSAGSIGWSASPDYHYLRVEIKYALCRVYTSTNGRTWTLFTSYTMNGQEAPQYNNGDLSMVGNAFFSRGAFGLIGKAYSAEDVWVDNPEQPPIPPPYDFPGLEVVYDEISDRYVSAQDETLLPGYVFAISTSGQAAVTRTINAVTGVATWLNISSGLPSEIYSGCIDAMNVLGRYALGSTGLFMKSEIYSTSSWVQVATNLQMFGNADRIGYKVISSGLKIIVLCGRTGVGVSEDQGATWIQSSLEYTIGGIYASPAAAAAAALWSTVTFEIQKSDVVVSTGVDNGEVLFYSAWFSSVSTSAISCSVDGISWIDSSGIPAVGTGFNGAWRLCCPYRTSRSEYNNLGGSGFVNRVLVGFVSGNPNGYENHKIIFYKGNTSPSMPNMNHGGPKALDRKSPIASWGKDGSRIVASSTVAGDTANGGVWISDDLGETGAVKFVDSSNYYASITISPMNKNVMLYWAALGLFSATGILYLTIDGFDTKFNIVPSFFTNSAVAYADVGLGF